MGGIAMVIALLLAGALIAQFAGVNEEIEDTNDIFVGVYEALTEASTGEEGEYLDALAEATSHSGVSNLWDGLEKQFKQNTWFLLEDAREYKDSCEDIEYCDEHDELNDFIDDVIRGLETEIKAYEEWEADKIQEGNNLFSSAVKAYEDADVYSYTDTVNIRHLSSSQERELIDAIFSRTKLTADSIKAAEKTCGEINWIFHDYSRYKKACSDEAKTTAAEQLDSIERVREIDPDKEYTKFPSNLQSACWQETGILYKEECDLINELYKDFRSNLLSDYL